MSPNRPPKVTDEMRALLRYLGSKGGTKRAETLSPEERRKIARKAALARWWKARKKRQ